MTRLGLATVAILLVGRRFRSRWHQSRKGRRPSVFHDAKRHHGSNLIHARLPDLSAAALAWCNSFRVAATASAVGTYRAQMR
jgi:hypothetical protein